jgi:hypothetical protein
VNLPRISKPLTASQLRDRVLLQLNGESVALSEQDKRRRVELLARMREGRRA